MADSTIVVSFKLGDDGAIKAVRQFKGEVASVPQATAAASSGFASLSTALKGVAAAFAALKIGQFMRDAINTAAEEQRVLQGLASSLQTVGVNYNDVSRELQGMFGHLQATTRYADDEGAAALQKLIAVTGQYETSVKLLGPTLDFATAMHIDLETAARLVGQAMSGMTGTLSRYGVVLDESTREQLKNADAMERAEIVAGILNEKFGGAAAADMATYSARVQRLTNYWDDFKQAIGDVIVKTSAAPGVFDMLTEAVKGLTEFAKDAGEVFVYIANIDYGALWRIAVNSIASAWVALERKATETGISILKAFQNVPGVIDRTLQPAIDNLEESLAVLDRSALILAGSIDDDLSSAFDDANDAANTYRDAVENLTASVAGGGGAIGGDNLADAAKKATDYVKLLEEATKRAGVAHPVWTRAMVENIDKLEKVEEKSLLTAVAIKEVGVASEDSANLMVESFSDMISRGFTGELESFADIWEEIWTGLARSMTKILSDSFEGVFKPGGGGLSRGISNFMEQVNPSTGIIAGAGMVYSGYQQGGTGGMIQGALGGAMAGTMIAPGIGTIIGAVLGGVASLFGGDDTPRGTLTVTPTTGTIGRELVNWQERDAFTAERVEEYRASIMGMNSVLRLFESGGLFDLIDDAPTFSMEGTDADQLATFFRERWLPRAMQEMFIRPINEGLYSYHVDTETIAQLWSELDLFTGPNMIAALETYIGALVSTSHLWDDMDWNTILDETRMDSMTSFLTGMQEAVDAVRIQMLGLDQMTLIERAGQAQTIEQLITQARNAEIQMLRQIDQLQDGINRSIDSQIEGIRLGGMSDQDQQAYYQGQIADIMRQLRDGVSSPEAIQQLMADLQRYTGAYQSVMGEGFYTQSGFGGSEADWIVSILEEARGLSNEAFESMRDQIRETNDALIAELERLITALTHYGDSIATSEQVPPPPVDVNVGIDVTVAPSEWFQTWVDTRITRAITANNNLQGSIN